MRIPFVRRRATTTRRRRRTTTSPASTTTPGLAAGTTRRQVPGPEVMAGMEYLDTPRREAVRAPAPEVAVCGIDPQVPGSPAVPRLHLVVPDEGPEGTRPDSVEQLLARDGEVRVRRLTVDVRGLRDVLESRGGWNLLAALVRDPSDSVTNAVFRAAMSAPDSAGPAGAVLEPGDVDVEVCVVGEGDTVAGRCRRELGRGRLSLTGFLADSERLTRRLAEALARPRDRGTRRCFEHALADVARRRPAVRAARPPRRRAVLHGARDVGHRADGRHPGAAALVAVRAGSAAPVLEEAAPAR